MPPTASPTSRVRAASWGCLLVACTFLGCSGEEGVPLATGSRPKVERFAKIEVGAVNESSGFAASTRHPGLVWTHNDSGDGPRLYALTSDGKLWHGSPPGGILVAGASAVDWEAITLDGSGNLVIGDVGNNDNIREDLTVHFLPEPDPAGAPTVRVQRSVRVRYPDQLRFPPDLRNFDCEAIFWYRERLHFLTKHRSDSDTKLYRLDQELPFPKASTLTLIGSHPIRGAVTAADCSPDGRRLAVLTYGAVSLFEPAPGAVNPLNGVVSTLSVRMGQCEAICLEASGDSVLVGNEAGDLFRIPLSQLRGTEGGR